MGSHHCMEFDCQGCRANHLWSLPAGAQKVPADSADVQCLPACLSILLCTCRQVNICNFAYTSTQQMRLVIHPAKTGSFGHIVFLLLTIFSLLVQAHTCAVSTLICLAPVARLIVPSRKHLLYLLKCHVFSRVVPCQLQWQIRIFAECMHMKFFVDGFAWLFRWSESLQRETTLGICVQRH